MSLRIQYWFSTQHGFSISPTTKWTIHPLLDGYISTLVVGSFLLTLAHEKCRYWASFVLVALFAIVQLVRLRLISSIRVELSGCHGVDGRPGTVNYSYGYSYALARRRAKSTKSETTTPPRSSEDADDDEQVTTTRRLLWHKDHMGTYRHSR